MAITTFNGILYFNTVLYFTKWINDILLCAYIVGYIMWSTILIYSFMYRTLAVRHKEQLVFTPVGYAILSGLMGFIGFLYAKIIYSFPASNEIMTQLRERVYQLTGLEITQLSCLGGVFTVRAWLWQLFLIGIDFLLRLICVISVLMYSLQRLQRSFC